MKGKLRLLLGNKYLRISVIISMVNLFVCAAIFSVGHYLIGEIGKTKSAIMDFSNPVLEKRYRVMMSDYKNSETDRQVVRKVKVTKEGLPVLVQFLESYAASARVSQSMEITDELPAGKKADSKMTEIKYRINATGNLDSLLSYLNNINRAPFLARTNTVFFVSVGEEDLREAAVATIDLAIAYRE